MINLMHLWCDFQTVRREANRPIRRYVRQAGPFFVYEGPTLAQSPYSRARSRLPKPLVWLAHRTAVTYKA